MERGTLARVDNVLEKFEDRSHMLRQANRARDGTPEDDGN